MSERIASIVSIPTPGSKTKYPSRWNCSSSVCPRMLDPSVRVAMGTIILQTEGMIAPVSPSRIALRPNPGMNVLSALLTEEPDGLIEEISPNDGMFVGNRIHYFAVAQGALECIRVALLAAGKQDVRSILDLPCGHGRVLRKLKAEFPDAALTGCDIERDGVDFC